MEKRRILVEYDHFEVGDRVKFKCGAPDVYTIAEVKPPCGDHASIVRLATPSRQAWFAAHELELVPPEPITDAERMLALEHPSFWQIRHTQQDDYTGGDKCVGRVWILWATDHECVKATTGIQWFSSAVEALDCWVMELRRRNSR